MSNKCQNEDSGLTTKKSSYTSLGNAWVYSCPQTDINYSGINSVVNCLCPKNEPRTVMDQYYINKTMAFPVSNKRLGWKL